MRGVGDYFADDANLVEVPAWHAFTLTLSTARPIVLGRFGLTGFIAVENLTGPRYIGSAFVNPDVVAGEPVAFEPGAPRSLIVSVSIGSSGR